MTRKKEIRFDGNGIQEGGEEVKGIISKGPPDAREKGD